MNVYSNCLFTKIVTGVIVTLSSLMTQTSVSQAQTEVPISYIAFTSYSGNTRIARFVVPNSDTTVSAYGGQLRLYDVHVAKMFELTDYECQTTDRNWSNIAWRYQAGGGDIEMGTFFITCDLAREMAISYGLGEPELTNVTYYRANTTISVPILNIVGDNVERWLTFTSTFRPEFPD